MSRDPARIAIRVGVYIMLAYVGLILFGWGFAWTDQLIDAVIMTLLSGAVSNWLTLRIFEGRSLTDAGLWWNRASSANLLIGLAGGVGAVIAVLAPPLLFRAAHEVSTPADLPTFGMIVFAGALLVCGAFAEELLFRGYAFQVMVGAVGPYASIIPFAVLFGLMHSGNPNASWMGLVNTGAFGVLFGYAYLRSRDLWLPIGLHLGWNLTLPLFGVNLSGLRMKVTGYEMSWTAGALWSGGEYGPEASILTSIVVLVLFVYLWKAPIRRQCSPISDPPAEKAVCEPSPVSPS